PGRLLLRGQQHQRGQRGAPVAKQLSRALGRGLREVAVKDGDGIALGMDREGTAERSAAGLAVDLDGVPAWAGAEYGGSALPQRGPRRARASPPGALLSPRLAAAASDLAARSRGGGSASPGV